MIRIFPFLVLIFFISCEAKKKNTKSKKKTDTTDGFKKYYYSDGKLKTELIILNGKRNGNARIYYKNGKVSLEMNYKNGLRDGVSKRYYEDGTIYQETNYKDDKINGERKKYRENGKILSIAKYEKDLPCLNLKEVLQNGEIKNNYPQLIITPEDKLKREGVYIINLSLSDRVRKVNYYIGKLSSTGCLNDRVMMLHTDTKKDIGFVKYNLPPGGFMMEELNFIAEIETVMGNSYLTQKKFFVSIEN